MRTVAVIPDAEAARVRIPVVHSAVPMVDTVPRSWPAGAPGVLTLPSGRQVRGRAWRHVPPGPLPDYGVYLLGRPPAPTAWEFRWVRWRDFRLPDDPAALRAALVEALGRAADERVEVSCRGGTGRTGTALACLAVLDGVPAGEAVAWVRARYRPRAVETRAQTRLVSAFR